MVVLSKKELKKEKKRIYNNINAEVNPRMEEIKKVSPLYDFAKGTESRKDIMENRIDREEIAKDIGCPIESVSSAIEPNKLHKGLWEMLLKLIKYDIAFTEYGIEDAKKDREGCLSAVAYFMHIFKTKEKYEMVEKISNINLLSKTTSARILTTTYYENDEMKSVYTEKIANLLFDKLDFETTLSVLECDIDKYENIKDENIKEEMRWEDVIKLKELIEKDEIFYVYRGFLVEQGEYVRLGKKEDGDAYYMWNAGVGISFSIDEDIAKYFCYWKMIKQEKVLPEDMIQPKEYQFTPSSLYTKKEFIDQQSQIVSQMIDKCGKKPIVAKFMIDPKTIRSHNVGKLESEVIIKPEDAQLVSYKILNSKEMVDGILKRNKYTEDASNYKTFFEKERIVSLIINGMENVYAKSEDVYERVVDAKNIIQNAAKEDDEETAEKTINDIFKTLAEFAVSTPQMIKPGKSLTREVIDWFSRKPERILEKTS